MASLTKKLNEAFDKAVNTETKWFNWKLGTMGGSVSGIVNYFVNSPHGVIEGLRGGVNQFMYNFLMGGINSKICENLAKRINNDYLAIISASLVPTAVSFGVNYLWHEVLGTAEPMDSTTWQIPLNMISLGTFGHYWRRQSKKEKR